MKTISEIMKAFKKPLDVKWKIQSKNFKTHKASCVAFIDARIVHDVLDDTKISQNQNGVPIPIHTTARC